MQNLDAYPGSPPGATHVAKPFEGNQARIGGWRGKSARLFAEFYGLDMTIANPTGIRLANVH
jgi:hypothetical protein